MDLKKIINTNFLDIIKNGLEKQEYETFINSFNVFYYLKKDITPSQLNKIMKILISKRCVQKNKPK
jgi:uncharacterized protein YjgD (DUF1641 family)